MLQIAVLAVAVGLVFLGIKGFTASGIPITKTFSLNGTRGKIVGVICVLAGLAFVPAFVVAFLVYGSLMR